MNEMNEYLSRWLSKLLNTERESYYTDICINTLIQNLSTPSCGQNIIFLAKLNLG